jgi:hypothetical protein
LEFKISDIINKKNPVAKNAILIPKGLELYLFFLFIVKLNIIIPITYVNKPIINASNNNE